MPWLLTSPGHQQPWYWLCRIGRFLSYLKKDFNYLRHISVEKWQKCKYMFMFPLKNLACKGLIRCIIAVITGSSPYITTPSTVMRPWTSGAINTGRSSMMHWLQHFAWSCWITHWCSDKMAYMLQIVFSSAFLPEASFGLRVLSSPASVGLCVCVSITSLSGR